MTRAFAILSKNSCQAEAAIACVNEHICSGCGICKTGCPYNAIEIVAEGEKNKAQVTDALCKGCGACAAACPSGAMEQKGFKSALSTVESSPSSVESNIKSASVYCG